MKRRAHIAQGSSPQAYLFQSTRKRSLNYLRHERVEREAEPQMNRERRRRRLERTTRERRKRSTSRWLGQMDRLPTRCREVLS